MSADGYVICTRCLEPDRPAVARIYRYQSLDREEGACLEYLCEGCHKKYLKFMGMSECAGPNKEGED